LGFGTVFVASRDIYRIGPERMGRIYLEAKLIGESEAIAKILGKLLSLPALKQLQFQIESAADMDESVEAVCEGKSKNAEDLVKMVKEDRSSVPSEWLGGRYYAYVSGKDVYFI
jgi:hypothetical protein